MMKQIVLILVLVCQFTGLSALNRFAVITPEKTGTHLLTKQLTLLTGMEVRNCWKHHASVDFINKQLNQCEANHQYFHMHAFDHKHIIKCFEKRGYRVVCLLRDPRDQLISLLNYIRDRGWRYGPFRMDHPFGQLSYDEQIEEMITGMRYGVSVPHEIYSTRKKWMEQKWTLTVKYEDLVGPNGGGSKARQIRELRYIADHIQLTKTDQQLSIVADKSYGKPGEKTFSKGKIGQWQTVFKDYHKSLFKTVFGNQLIQMGYENDHDW